MISIPQFYTLLRPIFGRLSVIALDVQLYWNDSIRYDGYMAVRCQSHVFINSITMQNRRGSISKAFYVIVYTAVYSKN